VHAALDEIAVARDPLVEVSENTIAVGRGRQRFPAAAFDTGRPARNTDGMTQGQKIGIHGLKPSARPTPVWPRCA